MAARMLAVAVMMAPGLAMARGGHGHVHGGGHSFGGGFGSGWHRPPADPPERWDTPVDKVPDWDQREAQPQPREVIDTGRSHVGAPQKIIEVAP